MTLAQLRRGCLQNRIVFAPILSAGITFRGYMATAKSISLQVSDIVRWFKDGELVINEIFQRHSVWTTAAKTYLIDTLLIPEKSPAKSDASPVTGIQLPIITTGCARSLSQSLGEDAQAETA
jgi:archaellum biogenesis ATPase FlaH